MSKAQGERYAIILRAIPNGTPGIRRLRAALKLMLRGYDLRCEQLRLVDEHEGGGADT